MLNELSYDSAIAQVMLKRQQAAALIEARQRIVEGATSITKKVLQDEELASFMTAEERGRLAANLLVVLAGNQDPSPVLPLND